jgi:hypothetical protein
MRASGAAPGGETWHDSHDPVLLERALAALPAAVGVVRAEPGLPLVYGNPPFLALMGDWPAGSGLLVADAAPWLDPDIVLHPSGSPQRVYPAQTGAGWLLTAHPLPGGRDRESLVFLTPGPAGPPRPGGPSLGAAASVLLQAEVLASDRPEDARHWVAIYERLVEFQEELATRTRARADARRASTDVGILEAELDRLRGRLGFWRERHWQLAGLEHNDGERTLTHAGVTVQLTPREYQLFSVFLASPGRWFKSRELVSLAWGDPNLSSEQLRIYIVRLRRHLTRLGDHLHLLNRPGRGYLLHLG